MKGEIQMLSHFIEFSWSHWSDYAYAGGWNLYLIPNDYQDTGDLYNQVDLCKKEF